MTSSQEKLEESTFLEKDIRNLELDFSKGKGFELTKQIRNVAWRMLILLNRWLDVYHCSRYTKKTQLHQAKTNWCPDVFLKVIWSGWKNQIMCTVCLITIDYTSFKPLIVHVTCRLQVRLVIYQTSLIIFHCNL